jgi:hypothetical protein
MPETTEKGAVEIPSLPAFLKTLHLSRIALKESSCEIDRDRYWKEDREKDISLKLTTKPISVNREHFDVRSTLMLGVKTTRCGSSVLKVSATFDLHFHAEPIEDFVEKLCQSEIRLIVWPYFNAGPSSHHAWFVLPLHPRC